MDSDKILRDRLKLFDNYKNSQSQSDNNEMHTSGSDQIPGTSFTQNGPHIRQQSNSNNPVNERLSKSNNIGTQTAPHTQFCDEINMSLGNKDKCNQETSTSKEGTKSEVPNQEEIEWMNMEKPSCQRYKPCHEKTSSNTYDFNVPSTSTTNITPDNLATDYNNCRDNRKRPSSLKLNRPNVEGEDSSSDTGNDDYSLGSEDGCIYTYRGGEHLADLPSSFFSLDMGLPLDKHLPVPPHYGVRQDGGPNNRGSRASSPDQDFLEMDFDPGPSCEADTGGKSSPEEGSDVSDQMPDDVSPIIREDTPVAEPEQIVEEVLIEPVHHEETKQSSDNDIHAVPSTSRGIQSGSAEPESEAREVCTEVYGPYITHVNFRGERLLVRRTTASWTPSSTIDLHSSGADVISPIKKSESDAMWAGLHHSDMKERMCLDNSNLASVLYHQTMAKKLIVEMSKADFVDGTDSSNLACEAESVSEVEEAGLAEVPRNMIWSEQEACERQIVQTSASSCGVVAVINAFLALGIPVDAERIKTAIGIRQRHNDAPLARYLLSRSVAGCTAADLVTGAQRASEGMVTARFFPLHPERAMSLSHWLADWISIGAVPILTMNLQAGCEGDIPDAWHHQMVFGVSSRGVFLCNPAECVPESALWPRLTSPSTLLVRTRDVLSRFAPCCDLTPLMHVPDDRYHTFNVLGQVVNVIREWRAAGWTEERTRTRYLRIPAAYVAGVTVLALLGTEAHRRLAHAPLPPTLTRRPSDGTGT